MEEEMDELLAFPFLQSLKDKDIPAKKAQDGPPKATGGDSVNEDQEYRLTLRSCKEKGDELDGDELYELELLERLDSGEELHEDEVDKLDNL